MFDISFIVQYIDLQYDISNTLSSLVSILNYTDKAEIVIINTSGSDIIPDEISEYERIWNENIVIVNTEATTDIEMIKSIGVLYSDSYCSLLITSHLSYICPSLFDNMEINPDICDHDRFKYIKDKYVYISMCFDKPLFRFDQANEKPMMTDYRDNAGSVDAHYFFQDVYVANNIFHHEFKHVYDIGSRVDGYISHLLAMDILVTMIDIRPLPFKIDNLNFIEGDATNLSNIKTGSIYTLSCLHALEHFGLGRYGDPLDHDGWKKALASFKRIIAINGYLYLSVPVGKYETVMFNAHRIFNPMTIISNLMPTFILSEFTLFHEGVRTTFNFSNTYTYDKLNDIFRDIQDSLMGYYDCGIFIFRKK